MEAKRRARPWGPIASDGPTRESPNPIAGAPEMLLSPLPSRAPNPTGVLIGTQDPNAFGLASDVCSNVNRSPNLRLAMPPGGFGRLPKIEGTGAALTYRVGWPSNLVRSPGQSHSRPNTDHARRVD